MSLLHGVCRIIMRDTSIIKKLLLVVLVLILLPVATTCLILYLRTSQMLVRARLQTSATYLEYAQRVIVQKLEVANSYSVIVATNPLVQDILRRDRAHYTREMQHSDMRMLLEYFRGIEADRRILRVWLLVGDGLLYSNEGSHIMSTTAFEHHPWFEDLMGPEARLFQSWQRASITYLAGSHPRQVVRCFKAARDVEDFDKVLGLVVVDIAAEEIEGTLAEACATKDSVLWVVNERGDAIASVHATGQDSLLRDFGRRALASTGQRVLRHGGRAWIGGTLTLGDEGASLLSLVPLRDVYVQLRRVAAWTLLLLVGLTGFTFLIGYSLFRTSFERVRRLLSEMRHVQGGNLDVEIRVDGRDEIAEIERNFNAMIEKLRVLLEERFQLGRRVQEAEVRVLRAQINPHFLYNALNSISWAARDYGAERVCRMLRSLSEFYKVRLHSARDESTVAEEIRHVELYVDIQNMRYGDSLRLSIDVPDTLMNVRVPTMTLQPLVENSIVHGILGREKKQGCVRILGEQTGSDAVLSVIDDGVGMESTQVATIMAQASTDGEYGVRNVHERIRMRYGAGYGLHFETGFGKGTRVDVHVPVDGQIVVSATES